MCAEAESLEVAGAFASAEGRESAAENAAGVLSMKEAAFRAFYERTAPQLRAYLRRASGNYSTADDLLQECYLRLLRARMAPTEEAHRRHYLFRIAANLLTDHFRGARHAFEEFDETSQVSRPAHANLDVERDMDELLSRLKPKERSLLWLAYVEGYRHEEIAQILCCRAASVRPMLFRARQRLAKLLRVSGWKRTGRNEERP